MGMNPAQLPGYPHPRADGRHLSPSVRHPRSNPAHMGQGKPNACPAEGFVGFPQAGGFLIYYDYSDIEDEGRKTGTTGARKKKWRCRGAPIRWRATTGPMEDDRSDAGWGTPKPPSVPIFVGQLCGQLSDCLVKPSQLVDLQNISLGCSFFWQCIV